jgi:O-antigen/teichoic acid export membrane protein
MMGRLYLGLGYIGVVILTAISPLLVKWFTTPAYYEAYPLIGILALQPLGYGFQLIASAGFWKMERTIWSPVSLGISVTVNIILAIWLVPQYSGMGAAIATAFAYFVWNAVAIVVSEKLWPVSHSLGIFALQTAIGVSAIIGITLFNQNHEFWKVIILAVMSSVAILGITIKRSHLEWMLSELRKQHILLT